MYPYIINIYSTITNNKKREMVMKKVVKRGAFSSKGMSCTHHGHMMPCASRLFTIDAQTKARASRAPYTSKGSTSAVIAYPFTYDKC